jgi:hypothetical protein
MKHNLASPFYIQHLVNQIIKPHSAENMIFFGMLIVKISEVFTDLFSMLGALHFLKSHFF